MSSPIRTVSSQALVFEALMAMMQDNIKHLGVRDAGERLIGIVTNQDILTAQSQSPVFLIRGIADALTLADLKEQHQLLPGVIQGLISSGASSKNLTRLVTTISDAILKKVVELALRDQGEPPCGFAFMVLGSEGRKEQTLKTDQDNAIVFEDVSPVSLDAVRSYFLRLGETVCTGLNEVGFDFCPGEIMARNPKWCQPISVWKNTFLTWMRAAESDDLLQSTIFFDFRCGFGRQELVDELRGFLMESLSDWSFFFRHMAENAQLFKPPIGFFRNFIVESRGDHRDSFDIKKAMVPVVDFARIFALKHKIAETNTQDRLHQLYLTEKIQWETFNEIDHAYGFLMQLRFLRQIHAVAIDKVKPDNYINPKKLTRIEQTMLKEIFARIANLQNEMSSWLFGS
jgi:CBS domain-containing protein